MLKKFLKVHKLAGFSRGEHPKPEFAGPPPTTPEPVEEKPMALKVVHVGGVVECYYMAIPAATILEKYPGYVLAKPEVFRRPWNSVARPEKILVPGQKFYLVPSRTVKKLRGRIRKPRKDLSASFVSQDDASFDMVSDQENDVSSNSLCQSNVSDVSRSFNSAFKKKKTGIKKHVRFAGIDVKNKAASSTNSEKTQESSRKSPKSQPHGGKHRKTRQIVAWEPSLTSIIECQGN